MPIPRFLDSRPLRIGIGFIGLIVTGWAVLFVANRFWGFNPYVGPAGIWSMLWTLLGLGWIAVGIGQTMVRRSRQRREEDMQNKHGWD